MIAADMEFHFFLYGLSQNPLVAETSSAHWSYLRRVMGEVLLHGETPGEIWDQHEAILDAVIAGNTTEAERLAREHISHASTTLTERLAERSQDDMNTAMAVRPARKRA
jgi:DNA-binding GntR family transcriptional regulator